MSLILVIGLAKWLFMSIVTMKIFENKKQTKEWKEVEDILEQITKIVKVVNPPKFISTVP